MSEELLNEAYVGPVFEHVGGAGVAQQVTGAGVSDVGFVDDASDPVADISW